MKNEIERLMRCFPKCFINSRCEIILHERANIYFRLDDIVSVDDIKYKVLAYLSRAAFKTEPYHSNYQNALFHSTFRKNINNYLGTDFDFDDFELIYTKLGNDVNKPLGMKFIKSGYDMGVLKDG